MSLDFSLPQQSSEILPQKIKWWVPAPSQHLKMFLLFFHLRGRPAAELVAALRGVLPVPAPEGPADSRRWISLCYV